ncbi:hypothetical protein FQN54_006503 [Arachnomyces sp. PD_36]|nr:hypothetical protein FQN54_006503 [Arachnomyces sp. PD_36]
MALSHRPATLEDKITGTIVGSALGDTIGLYTEFLSKDDSIKAYPDRKFRLVDPATELSYDGHRCKFERRAWTDDTDHALLILLSYLHHDGTLLPSDLATRLRSWVEQGLRCLDRLPLGLGNTVGRVVLNSEFPTNPSAVAYKLWNSTNRNIAPNGSLMRTHPLGVICLNQPSLASTFEIAAKFSIITHADPRCVVSCCIVTGLIRGILKGEVTTETDMESIIDKAFAWVNGWIKSGRKFSDSSQEVELEGEPESLLDQDEFNRHTHAQTFKDLQLDDSRKIGYVYKALGSAILSLRLGIRQSPRGSAASPKVFEDIITELVMEGGDADTNACSAAALLGCWVGCDALPPHWRDGMLHRDWMLRKCNGMMEIMGILSNSNGEKGYKGSEDRETRVDGGKGFLTKDELQRREMMFMIRYTETLEEQAKKERNKTRSWFSKLLRR